MDKQRIILKRLSEYMEENYKIMKSNNLLIGFFIGLNTIKFRQDIEKIVKNG